MLKFADYQPPGPVASAFLHDNTNLVRFLLGPVGAGKTVACVFDLLSNAGRMPVCTDGRIRFRAAVIGKTYGQVERNLLSTWFSWVPKDGGAWTQAEFKGGGGRYAIHEVRFQVRRNGAPVPVDCEFIFAAIGDQMAEQFMRGFEPTCFYLYEADQLAEDVLDHAISRLGRYPRQQLLQPGTNYRPYVIGDLNAPDVDNWVYRRFEEQRPHGHRLYRQPSGRSARAENLHNLPPDYYTRQVRLYEGRSLGQHLIRRYVDAQFAPSLDGEPVYPQWNDDAHLAPADFPLVDKVPIRIGLDAGLRRPAAVIGQWLHNGQWRIWREFVPGRMSGPEFGRRLAEFLRREGASRHQIAAVYADPFGETGRIEEESVASWNDAVSQALGETIFPTDTNEIDARISAVSEELATMIDAHTPAILLNPTCRMLRKGFASHYCYRREKVGNTERTSEKPDKRSVYADPHDALQYLVLGSKGLEAVTSGRRAIAGDRARDDVRAGVPAAAPVIRSSFMEGGW